MRRFGWDIAQAELIAAPRVRRWPSAILDYLCRRWEIRQKPLTDLPAGRDTLDAIVDQALALRYTRFFSGSSVIVARSSSSASEVKASSAAAASSGDGFGKE